MRPCLGIALQEGIMPGGGYKKGYKISWVVEGSHGKAKRHLGPHLYIHGAIVWMGNLLR